MADIFVSYTSSDRTWAHWIATELRALDHTQHVHEWEIGGGHDILAWMEQRFGASDQVLCVVSEAYLKAPYSTLERNAAIWRAVGERRPGSVLFVVVQPCALPPLFAHFKRCELFGLAEEVARTRFRAFMTAPAAPAETDFPGHGTAESNITILVPHHFMGRDEAMAEIDATLGKFNGRAAITALHGMRGVGKTMLCAAYAQQHRQRYRATWWVHADNPDLLRTDLVELGHRLGWAVAGEAQDAAVARVVDRLAREGESILLIFDNAPDADAIRPFLPRGGAAQVLITSNAHAWSGVARTVEIRLWPREIGAAYLLARCPEGNTQAAAEALSDALDGLPLAHDMAASFCDRQGVSLAPYHVRFAAEPVEMLDDARFAPADFHDRLTVAKAFKLAIDAAAKLHPAAEPLLVAAALLPPEPIPLFLFADGRAALAERLGAKLQGHGTEDAVAALRSFALVDLETIPDERDAAVTTQAIRLHRLIRLVAGWRRDKAAVATIKRGLFGAFDATYPREVFDPKAWPRCRRLDAIATFLLDRDAAEVAVSDAVFANMLIWVGQYRQATATYRFARPLFERALVMFERTRGPEHPQTGVAAANLALLLQAEGELATARPLFERDLAITEQALGAEHPDTATSLDNLAVLLQAQGDLAAAWPRFERALAIREKALGAEHPDTANSLNNLAVLLQAQGDLAAARPLFERALAIYEKALGAEHPDTLGVVANLAGLLDDERDTAGAEKLHRRALEGRIRAKGATHPDVLSGQNNLAHSLRLAGRADLAEPYARACADNTPAVLGAAHPLTAHRRNNLALTVLMMRRAVEADALLADTWRGMQQHHAIVAPVVAFLALLSAGLQGRSPADPIGRLKTLLLCPPLPRAAGVAQTWDVGYRLADLRQDLPEEWPAFLEALLAAINDPAQAPALDRFPLWHDTPAVPADAPWPEAGTAGPA